MGTIGYTASVGAEMKGSLKLFLGTPFVILALSGCATTTVDDASPAKWDADGDGYFAEGPDADCDDFRAGVHPGAQEICGQIDFDCDGLAGDLDPDSEGRGGWAASVDQDRDGFGSGPAVYRCVHPPGWSTSGGDCDDGNPDLHPEAGEMCNGIDDNCNGLVDGDDGVWVGPSSDLKAPDEDGDGYGSAAVGLVACGIGVTNALDCDDAKPFFFEEELWWFDADGDAYGSEASGSLLSCGKPDEGWYKSTRQDCNDADASVSPDADEVCNGVDDDCDGVVDVGASYANGVDEWYEDVDGDGVGEGVGVTSCEAPDPSMVSRDGDCAPEDPAIPMGFETCDEGDEDCDGLEGLWDPDHPVADVTFRPADNDGDGYGSPTQVVPWCGMSLAASALNADDCDDWNALAKPDAVWFWDGDGDGFGDPALTVVSCLQPDGTSADQDCDDSEPASHPGARERQTGPLDEDCDGDALRGTLLSSAPELVISDAFGYGAPPIVGVPDLNGDGASEWLAVDSAGRRLDLADGVTSTWIGDPFVALESDMSDTAPDWADVDGDGKWDLVIGNAYYDLIAPQAGVVAILRGEDPEVMVGASLGSAMAAVLGHSESEGMGRGVHAADIDGDGLIDLAASEDLEGNRGRVGVFKGDLSGAYLNSDDAAGLIAGDVAFDSAGQTIESGDIDGDGVREVMMLAPGSPSVGLMSGLPAGLTEWLDLPYLLAFSPDETLTAPMATLRHDVDGDGLVDVAALGEGVDGIAHLVVWTRPTPGVAFADELTTDITSDVVGDCCETPGAQLGDFDGDGTVDALLTFSGSGSDEFLRAAHGPLTGVRVADGVTWETLDTPRLPTGPAIDLQGDGVQDIVVALGNRDPVVAILWVGPW